jgi:hypothetical protein
VEVVLMVQVLAIRDCESGVVVTLRELGAKDDASAVLAEQRRKLAPPRYETVIGMAASLDVFLKAYPRFARGAGDKGGGDAADDRSEG